MDNYFSYYIANRKKVFVKGSFKKVTDNNVILVGNIYYNVVAIGNVILKKRFNELKGEAIRNLKLQRVKYILNFYINIISAAKLRKKSFWILRLDNTLKNSNNVSKPLPVLRKLTEMDNFLIIIFNIDIFFRYY